MTPLAPVSRPCRYVGQTAAPPTSRRQNQAAALQGIEHVLNSVVNKAWKSWISFLGQVLSLYLLKMSHYDVATCYVNVIMHENLYL